MGSAVSHELCQRCILPTVWWRPISYADSVYLDIGRLQAEADYAVGPTRCAPRVSVCIVLFSRSECGGQLFGIGSTPEIALGTSVLYLIPGVPYINAVSDIIYKHYLCAFSRFADAAVLTACLTVGLCTGMLILGLKWF